MAMHLIIDLQTCQSESWQRGIGRSAIGLSRCLAEMSQENGLSICFVTNEQIADKNHEMDDFFSDISGVFDFFQVSLPSPTKPSNGENKWRNLAAEFIREHALSLLKPDMVLLPQLMADGWNDNTITTVKKYFELPTSVVHHDLIPLAEPEAYLAHPPFREFYFDKLSQLAKADLLLAISDYSAQELAQLDGFSTKNIVNISSGVDPNLFFPAREADIIAFKSKYFGSSSVKYILYVPGGFDIRKNFLSLFKAYAAFPSKKRAEVKLVIGSRIEAFQKEQLLGFILNAGLSPDEVLFTGFLTDAELRAAYSGADIFVFPSLHEGFGLPVFEAMSCGAPVIASNVTSLPEIVREPEFMFDPRKPEQIAGLLLRGLDDSTFRARVKQNSRNRLKAFLWKDVAERVVSAIIDHARTQNNHDKRENRLSRFSENLGATDLEALTEGLSDHELGKAPQHVLETIADLMNVNAKKISTRTGNNFQVSRQ